MRRMRIICFLIMALTALTFAAEAWPVLSTAGQEVKAEAQAAAQPETTPAAGAAEGAQKAKTGSGPTAESAAVPDAKPAVGPANRTIVSETAVKKPAGAKGGEKRTEPIVPAFSDGRQKSAVIVFYVWLWFSIIVLVYFLRLWIFEADRVYKTKYYDPEESPRKGNPLAPTLGE